MKHTPHWNWQQKDWPHFRYDSARLAQHEAAFLRESGVLIGAIRHIGEEDKKLLTVDLISNEAFKTSEIEGELLNRDSLISSIRRNFGLATDHRRIAPAEHGIAEMMMDVYSQFATPLSHEQLHHWHAMLVQGRADLRDIGAYRTDAEPMQVVSGSVHAPRVHLEAPPANALPHEMQRFVDWFNATAPEGKTPLPALTRCGMAHLYFESIHPFEDGNGRIGRALCEKVLAQALGAPTLIALSQTIHGKRKTYYEMLERSNKHNEITAWLDYFATTILDAQAYTQQMIDFLIAKTRFFDRFRGKLNARQEKAMLRMFRAGPEGFKGGLSAENYISITQTSRATATRDLQDLVQMGALTRTGERKGTRYGLVVSYSA